jgi:O-antigen ligase
LLGHVRRAWWPLLLALLACGLPLLLLTKSRTSLFGALIALLVVPFLKPTRGLIVALVVAVWSVGVVLLAALLLGLGVEDRLTDVILLGRAEHIGTFSGRTELWEELLTYVQARPLIGYGYSSFWTLQHIEDVSSSQFWGISEAHSVYLEAVLNVGLVGAGLLGVMVVCSFFQAVWSYRRDADPGIALTLMLLVFGMISGLTEADFLMTGNATFMTGCGVGYLAFFSEVSRA